MLRERFPLRPEDHEPTVPSIINFNRNKKCQKSRKKSRQKSRKKAPFCAYYFASCLGTSSRPLIRMLWRPDKSQKVCKKGPQKSAPDKTPKFTQKSDPKIQQFWKKKEKIWLLRRGYFDLSPETHENSPSKPIENHMRRTLQRNIENQTHAESFHGNTRDCHAKEERDEKIADNVQENFF